MSGFSKKISSIGAFLLELVVYAAFVSVYFFLVLHFLGDWLKDIFDGNKILYAVLALALIGVQGFLLEIVSSALPRVLRRN